jgi:hypothetical protein
MTLAVRRKLRSYGYEGIQLTGYTDANGMRLVVHDLIVYDVYVMVRGDYKRLTPLEQWHIDTKGYYVQYGSGSTDKLLTVIEEAKARLEPPKAVHWSWAAPATPTPTVGNALPWLTDTSDLDD